MKYLLDSNVFIEAKNRYYAFDVCPGFWDWMDHVVAGGDVLSLAMVREELLAGNDELAKWIGVRKQAQCFLGADPWLVAKAKAIGATVVTLEVRDLNCKKKVPLPNVCDVESVPFMNTFELLQKLAAQFHFKLPTPRQKAKRVATPKALK